MGCTIVYKEPSAFVYEISEEESRGISLNDKDQ